MVQSSILPVTVYCIDTSALINIWRVQYPPDIFPGLLRDIEGLIGGGGLIAPHEVLAELSARDDELHRWAMAHPSMFSEPTANEIANVRRVQERFPDLVDVRRTTPVADPFLVALAMERGCTVVTSERSGGRSGRPRIPDVCKHYRVRCVGLMDLFRERGWRY